MAKYVACFINFKIMVMVKKIAGIAVVITGLVLLFSFDTPRGWTKSGSMPDKYFIGIDSTVASDGNKTLCIQSLEDDIKGFGTLMQQIQAGNYLGKRLRLRGNIKSENVTGRAGLWLRIDQAGTSTPLCFDNMYNRPVTGNTGWTEYEIVLDVPLSATVIAFGTMLSGNGRVWFNNLHLETVSTSVPLTAPVNTQTYRLSSEPVNLNFEQ
jgi:hypothetical protein